MLKKYWLAHPGVYEAAVIPVTDQKWGEVPKAVVVAKPGSKLSEVELIEFCRARLAHYKCPQSIEFCESLPKTATGKVLKRELRKKYQMGIKPMNSPMNNLVKVSRDNDVAVITIDNPPVNALSPGVPEGIAAAIDEINCDPAVKAAVVIGGGRTFVAGADIKEFGKMTSGGPRRSSAPAAASHRRQRQAGSDGDSWPGIRRRPGTRHGRPLPGRIAHGAGRPAGSEARNYSRSRRNAASAAPSRASPKQSRCAPKASRSPRVRLPRSG